nr:uncharacterized protein LOC105477403 isoform X2 [Macaca nemestrina]
MVRTRGKLSWKTASDFRSTASSSSSHLSYRPPRESSQDPTERWIRRLSPLSTAGFWPVPGLSPPQRLPEGLSILLNVKRESSLTPVAGRLTRVWLICFAAMRSSPLWEEEHPDQQLQELGWKLLAESVTNSWIWIMEVVSKYWFCPGILTKLILENSFCHVSYRHIPHVDTKNPHNFTVK